MGWCGWTSSTKIAFLHNIKELFLVGAPEECVGSARRRRRWIWRTGRKWGVREAESGVTSPSRAAVLPCESFTPLEVAISSHSSICRNFFRVSCSTYTVQCQASDQLASRILQRFQYLVVIPRYVSLADLFITEIQKFHYLRAALKGEAANSIQSITITAEKYAVV